MTRTAEETMRSKRVCVCVLVGVGSACASVCGLCLGRQGELLQELQDVLLTPSHALLCCAVAEATVMLEFAGLSDRTKATFFAVRHDYLRVSWAWLPLFRIRTHHRPGEKVRCLIGYSSLATDHVASIQIPSSGRPDSANQW